MFFQAILKVLPDLVHHPKDSQSHRVRSWWFRGRLELDRLGGFFQERERDLLMRLSVVLFVKNPPLDFAEQRQTRSERRILAFTRWRRLGVGQIGGEIRWSGVAAAQFTPDIQVGADGDPSPKMRLTREIARFLLLLPERFRISVGRPVVREHFGLISRYSPI